MGKTLRSTARQNFSISLPRDGARWLAGHLALALRLALAAATAAMSFVVLSEDPPHQEMRLLLAALAVSLFLFSLIERSVVHHIMRPPVVSGGSDGDGAMAVRGDIQAKIKQLELHRTDYVGTVSHELRTPLTSIRGFAQLLAREEVPAVTSRSYASTIVAEADRLARIVDDILDLTKMENHILELRQDPVCTPDLLRSVVKQLQPALAPDRLQVSLPPCLPWVRGDRERLEQVLVQIILGAIEHAGSDVPISLTAEAGNDHITIWLEYYADPERIDRIVRETESLGKFSEDGLATRLGHGKLGMYISKNLIEAHGGTMRLIRAGGRAAVIAVTLPY